MKYDKNKPIYVQLIEQIKIEIINSTYLPGGKLPSIRDYAKLKMVNPNTVQRTFRELELQGFLKGKTGTGYYVNEDEKLLKKLKSEYLNKEIDLFINKMNKLNYSSEEIIEKVKEKL